jgi:hypothetical protein
MAKETGCGLSSVKICVHLRLIIFWLRLLFDSRYPDNLPLIYGR